MARKARPGPTERELDILQILWGHERASVREVHQALNEREELSFTSVQTMLVIMFDKDLVGRELEGRSYVYWPLVTREQAQGTLLEDLLERAFGGSAKALVSRALGVKPATPAELDEIQELIERARRE
jgi:predicted transcriptional regulator